MLLDLEQTLDSDPLIVPGKQSLGAGVGVGIKIVGIRAQGLKPSPQVHCQRTDNIGCFLHEGTGARHKGEYAYKYAPGMAHRGVLVLAA